MNRLTNVLANGNPAAGYGFDAVGNLQTLHYGNGVTNLYQYDSLNRLTNLVWRTNGIPIASFAYQLGASGNRTNLIESIHGSTLVNRTNQWQYDLTYRLTNETIIAPTTGSLTYGFDAVGNRLTRSYTGGLGLPTQTFSYNTNDWITNDLYDANGNTTNSASVSYQYDVENRLTNAGNGAVVIVYNGDGQRVSKTSGGMTTLYLVDSHNPSGYAQVLEELNVGIGTTNLARAYTYGMSLINQRLIDSSTNYYGMDGHGSVRFLMSTNAIITDTFTYDAYGILIASTGSTPNHYLYCAEQYDSELGMYYLRARYYQPNTGRFWSMDTSEGDQEDPLSLHKYLYCQNNPVNHIDPSGHDLGDVILSVSIGTYLAAQSLAPVITAVTYIGGAIVVAQLINDPSFRVEFAGMYLSGGGNLVAEGQELYAEIRSLRMASRIAPVIEETGGAGFTSAEQGLIAEARQIYKSSAMADLKAAHQAGKTLRVTINGRTIQTQQGFKYSAMTWKEKNGFILGDEAFTSEEELAKTIAHELHRLETGVNLAKGTAFPDSNKEETAEAFAFAQKAYQKIKE